MTRMAPRTRLPQTPKAKPASNIYTLLLIIAFAFLVTAIVFNELEMVGEYGMDIGSTLWPF